MGPQDQPQAPQRGACRSRRSCAGVLPRFLLDSLGSLRPLSPPKLADSESSAFWSLPAARLRAPVLGSAKQAHALHGCPVFTKSRQSHFCGTGRQRPSLGSRSNTDAASLAIAQRLTIALQRWSSPSWPISRAFAKMKRVCDRARHEFITLVFGTGQRARIFRVKNAWSCHHYQPKSLHSSTAFVGR